MPVRSTISFLFMLWLALSGSYAQNIAGFWLGVTYPTDPKQAIYNYTMTITQNGTTLGGTTQTSNPTLPFGGLAYLVGQITSTQVKFSEMDKNGSTTVKDICFWQGTMTYNAADESLIGTYENITNGTTCIKTGSGKVELYRIVLKSGTKFCKGSLANLVVTGKNIRWYSSASRTNVLATGNTYSPRITQTTTFYITQTLYQTESPAIPITIEVVEPAFKVIPSNTSCDQNNSVISITTADSTGWQYSLNGGAFQAKPIFTSLKPGSYTVVAKDATGCQGQQAVTLTPDGGPTISQLITTSPKCETANGSVDVVATGSKVPLMYSIDYGQTYQTSPTFTKLAGGAYTLRVRDVNGCEVNGAINLPAYTAMVVESTTGLPTSCGQANGQASMTTAGGISPVQYSIDKQTFQQDNTFAGLKSGSYTILARDKEGCTVSESISVAASTGPQLADIRTVAEGCGQKNGAILIAAKSSPDVLDYSIDGQTFQRTTDFSGLKAGNYTITVKDSSDCTATKTIVIALNCANLIHLPTAFSPNADHVNDAFTVHFEFPSLTVSRFTVYDRWGAVIYNRANFELSTGESVWDGQLNGRSAPAGIYVYRLDCQFPDGTQTSYQNKITLLSQ